MTSGPSSARAEILKLVGDYHAAGFPSVPFRPGEDPVPVSGKVFDADDLRHLVDASLDFWLTTGRYAERFEKDLAAFVGVPHAVFVNSGSSANLLALSALTSPRLGDRALREGDEVLTLAMGFPTTVNPVLQNRLIPVFLDTRLPTYDFDPGVLKDAVSPRTRAIFVAHTLGNPFAVEAVRRFADERGLWLIEDCCDALGSLHRGRKVGTFGHMATFSFYPAHHITTGEGGAVLTADPKLKTLLESFRDWGRDCWCAPGKDNTCGKRFDWQLGGLPKGFDHKYIFSHIGYNLKATDMQAAVGVSQLKKLPGFIAARRRNFEALRRGLEELRDFFILPEASAGSEPSWFGFPLAVRSEAPFSRADVVRELESRKIATRLLFGGNLTRQPAYAAAPHRKVGALSQSDFVMERAFWIGVYPGIDARMIDYTVEAFRRLAGELAR